MRGLSQERRTRALLWVQLLDQEKRPALRVQSGVASEANMGASTEEVAVDAGTEPEMGYMSFDASMRPWAGDMVNDADTEPGTWEVTSDAGTEPIR